MNKKLKNFLIYLSWPIFGAISTLFLLYYFQKTIDLATFLLVSAVGWVITILTILLILADIASEIKIGW